LTIPETAGQRWSADPYLEIKKYKNKSKKIKKQGQTLNIRLIKPLISSAHIFL
jgi:hypothetical protein